MLPCDLDFQSSLSTQAWDRSGVNQTANHHGAIPEHHNLPKPQGLWPTMWLPTVFRLEPARGTAAASSTPAALLDSLYSAPFRATLSTVSAAFRRAKTGNRGPTLLVRQWVGLLSRSRSAPGRPRLAKGGLFGYNPADRGPDGEHLSLVQA